METFAALRLEVNSWRWQGVPFYIRAGKRLPVTCTEMFCRLRKPPTFIPAEFLNSNYLRFRISPDVAIAMGMTVLAPGDKLVGQSAEMIASRDPIRRRWMPTSECSETGWPGTLCLHEKTTLRKHGES
jgi:glucose-6-phosphate 1-dehydrogenase